MSAVFRIEYTIQRADEEGGEFYDIGFGSSGGWSGIDAALYSVDSDVQNRMWQTEGDMPDPAELQEYAT